MYRDLVAGIWDNRIVLQDSASFAAGGSIAYFSALCGYFPQTDITCEISLLKTKKVVTTRVTRFFTNFYLFLRY